MYFHRETTKNKQLQSTSHRYHIDVTMQYLCPSHRNSCYNTTAGKIFDSDKLIGKGMQDK